MEKILVTGATGNVGKEVTKLLLESGQDVVVGGREAQKVQQIFGDKVAFRKLDFQNPATFETAFKDISKLFLVRPPAISDVKKYITPAIQAAKQAGVKQIVFLSLVGVERNKVVPHYKIEQAIKTSNVAWTFLRAGFFMQNLSTTHQAEIKTRSEIFVSAGKGKTAFIDVRDIAAVGAKVLTETGHQNKAYSLTGSQSLTYFEVADLFTQVLGKKINYSNPNPVKFVWRKWREKLPISFVVVMLAIYTTTRFGLAEKVLPDTARLLKRPPLTFQQFIEDYKEIWL